MATKKQIRALIDYMNDYLNETKGVRLMDLKVKKPLSSPLYFRNGRFSVAANLPDREAFGDWIYDLENVFADEGIDIRLSSLYLDDIDGDFVTATYVFEY